MLEDPANYGYFREEGGGLMLGMFEPVCAPWKVDGIPRGLLLRRAAAGLGADGARSWRQAMSRIPCPDGDRHPQVLLRPRELHARTSPPVVGEAPELKNYFVAAGPELASAS